MTDVKLDESSCVSKLLHLIDSHATKGASLRMMSAISGACHISDHFGTWPLREITVIFAPSQMLLSSLWEKEEQWL